MKIRGDIMLLQDEIYNQFVNDFSRGMYQLPNDHPFSDFIFLCIGSDKIIGDSYGPLVGDKLENLLKNMYQNIHVIGTLQEPISAVNLNKTIEKIYLDYKHPCMIAIDSALSQKEKVGTIYVSNYKMQCGNGTGKQIAKVGDISIKGIVGKDYKIPKYNFSSLQNASLGEVIKLANKTAEGIYNVIKYH